MNHDLASLPGLPRLQFLITCSIQSDELEAGKAWERGGEGLGTRRGRPGNEAGKVWERGGEGLGTRRGRPGNEAGKAWERGREGLGRLPGSTYIAQVPL